MGFWGSFGCCFVSGSSCWLQQCCFVMILAGDGGSDGFGVGYLVSLASSKLVRFMGCAPCGGRSRTAGLEVFGVGGCWLFEVEAGSLVVV
ncbi:hypothetical protein KY289_023514 [Solanum tuberosum]|nr:hypothetical protein KY289_023514 [Solanum tuberosum]